MTTPRNIDDRAGTRRRRSTRATVLSLFAATVVGGVAVWYVVVPYPFGMERGEPGPTAVMEQRIREAHARGEELEIRRTWIPLEEMSPALLRAVVTSEDDRFRQHRGVDWSSLAEEVRWAGDDDFSWRSAADLRALGSALRYAWSHRAELRGRSTITQQVAKNLYFDTDRSLARKAMELVVARRLERRLGKDRILELYLNIAEWGPGIFGAEAAARAYFGRSAKELDLSQAAALAATLPHPLTSNPAYQPARMRWRQALILDRLDPSRTLPSPRDVELVELDLDLRSRLPPRTTPELGELEASGADSSLVRGRAEIAR